MVWFFSPRSPQRFSGPIQNSSLGTGARGAVTTAQALMLLVGGLGHLATQRIEWQGWKARAVCSLFITISKSSLAPVSQLQPRPHASSGTKPNHDAYKKSSASMVVLQNHSQPKIHVGSSGEGMHFLPGVIPKKQRGLCSTFLSGHTCSPAAASLMHTSHRGGFRAGKAMRKGHVLHLQSKFHPPLSPKET